MSECTKKYTGVCTHCNKWIHTDSKQEFEEFAKQHKDCPSTN